jgi:hypothetical protein
LSQFVIPLRASDPVIPWPTSSAIAAFSQAPRVAYVVMVEPVPVAVVVAAVVAVAALAVA